MYLILLLLSLNYNVKSREKYEKYRKITDISLVTDISKNRSDT